MSHTFAARRLARSAAAGLLAAVLCTLAAPPALLAHTRLTRSEPAAGATLAEPPRVLRLWFSEAPQLPFTRLRLVAADSSERRLGPVERDAAGQGGIRAAVLETLAPGRYVVQWQTGGRDGHPIRGRIAFEVRTAGAVAAAPGQQTPHEAMHARLPAEPGESPREARTEYQAARWAEFIALLAVIGAVVFRLAVLPRLARGGAHVEDASESVRQLALGALVLLVATGLARLHSELMALQATPGALELATVRDVVTATSWGQGWLLGIAGALVTIAALLLARRARVGWMIALAGVACMALTPALTGHAASVRSYPTLAIVADALHVLAAGAWLGTLLVLTIAAVPAMLRRADADAPGAAALVHAFHPVALGGASLVVASGLVSTWLRLRTPAALVGTPYGRVLLLKLAAFAVVMALGALHWRRLGATEARGFRRTAALELIAAALVLAVTAVLVVTPPPE